MCVRKSAYSLPFLCVFCTHQKNDFFFPRLDNNNNKQGVVEISNENGEIFMKVPEKARHYGYTKQLAEPFDPKDGFAVQFEAAQRRFGCGRRI